MAKESKTTQTESVSVDPPSTQQTRKHKATYATDKRKGGYLVRVIGPMAAAFVGRTVPVTTKADTTHDETLTKLIWTGKDAETGQNVALYAFQAKPRDEKEQVEF